MCNIQAIPTPLMYCSPGDAAPVLAVVRAAGDDSLTWTFAGTPGTYFDLHQFLAGTFYPAVEGAGRIAITEPGATS